MVKAMQTRSKT